MRGGFCKTEKSQRDLGGKDKPNEPNWPDTPRVTEWGDGTNKHDAPWSGRYSCFDLRRYTG